MKSSLPPHLAFIQSLTEEYIQDPHIYPLVSYYFSSPGKGIRWQYGIEIAEILNSSYERKNWKEVGEKVGGIGEIIHLASLIHDDIVDGADKRRNLTALHLAYDIHQAVLTGDILLSLAYRYGSLFLQKETLVLLGEAVHLLATSQLSEIYYRQDSSSVDRIVSIIRGKTGALFAWIGSAVAVEMDCPSYAKPLWEYGMVLGEIYQTLDDLKDLLHADPTKPSVDERNQTPTLLTFLKKEKIPLSSYFLPHRESLQNPPLPSIPSVVERVLQEFEKYTQQIPSYGKEVME